MVPAPSWLRVRPIYQQLPVSEKVAQREGGYGLRRAWSTGFGRGIASIISRSPTARHPKGDQPPFDPPVRSPGDERDLLFNAALRTVAADRTYRDPGVGRDRGDPEIGDRAPPARDRRCRTHRAPGGAGRS